MAFLSKVCSAEMHFPCWQCFLIWMGACPVHPLAKLEMSVLCHVPKTPQMTFCPDTYQHVRNILKMSTQHWGLSRLAKQHVNKTPSKIFPTCWLILLDIQKKQPGFADTVVVRKSQKWYHIIFFLKHDCYLHQSNGLMSHGYGWAVMWQQVS